ncbi:membrane protein YfhO [Flavobacterium aquaticum]|uniref:Membrane protein YfhO n=1 Tax=Flavobacterium aquaticum TaxID=1236486 RepID=A0A327YI67_9FLAO|nr:YfhO family protein [Flavobacterium aquaticum]RAK20653.1 membrane protein YfhO [Flavobacterium aquaticum]
MKNIKAFYPHLLVVVGFILVSLFYFYPVLKGEKIFQSDIVQYTGMAKEQIDFRKETGEEPFWTNSAFGGMPTYQLGAKYPNDVIGMLDDALRFLPRPADYLFLYFLGFYVLLMVLKVDPLKAFFGALAFGLSTYLIIILGVGHNAKAHAIAYMPMVVAGVLLVFQRKYIIGGLLTMIAAALEINANHFQMTYYLLLLLAIIAVYYVVIAIKNKEFKELGKIFGVFAIAGILAIGTNATNLMATSEYAKFSTRNNSELTFNPDGSPKTDSNAMSYEYITEYSYGVAESLNLIAPGLFGGSNNENLGIESETYQNFVAQGYPADQVQGFVEHAPAYWGAQPIVAAPAYIGVVVFFLFVMAFFVEKRNIKYLFLAGAVFSLLLSWGKNFSILTDFFINYVPLYDKFRAVSSIQVILELCVPALAILGLYQFFKQDDEKAKWNALWKSGAITFGLLVVLFLIKETFNFSSANDAMYAQAYGDEFIRTLKLDREALYTSDVLRSMLFVGLTFVVLFLFVKNMMKETTAIIIVGVLMVFDLFMVDKRYVSNNPDQFKSAREVDMPFEPTEADQRILADTTHFRVFEVEGGMSSARTSFFHKSIGGYHAAKPRRMQQLFDYQIAKNNVRVLNMLNVKYVIQSDENGQKLALANPAANGNAWFVEKIKLVKSANEEMKALDSLDNKKVAVINNPDFGPFFKPVFKKDYVVDSLAQIKLVSYKPNYLKYISNNSNEGIAIFSEMYYENGWNVYINGERDSMLRANYVLRGLQIPAGKHTIEFKFEPEVVKTGSTIALMSSIGMLLLIGAGVYFERKKKIQD